MDTHPKAGDGGPVIIKGGDGGPGGPGGAVTITGDNGPVLIKGGDGGSIIVGEPGKALPVIKARVILPSANSFWASSTKPA